ncbi:MAG: hypothetical protein HY755_08355 [Nitrospirae bacterium]|nr:hypothetical protein [Nitrospirota bacterium]
MLIGFIIGLSVLIQLLTVFLALRLIRVTGGRIAWILISISIFLMGVRRIFSLLSLVFGDKFSPPNLLFELIGLITSILMLTGVVWISPLFNTIKQSEKDQRKLVQELQDAISKIKTLSGILPICASCKKIRDDKGYWNQVEAYISEHSEVDFSHGICPECAKKLYPEYYKEK